MDKVGNLHSGWTGDLTSLAVHAILQVLIEKPLVFQSETFTVRAGLFRTGIIRINCHHRTVRRIDGHDRAIGRTHRTFDALLKIIETDVLLLHVTEVFRLKP